MSLDPLRCEHPVIQTWRYGDNDREAGKVAMWACRDCRTRFAPGRQHPVPLPDPRMLGLSSEAER